MKICTRERVIDVFDSLAVLKAVDVCDTQPAAYTIWLLKPSAQIEHLILIGPDCGELLVQHAVQMLQHQLQVYITCGPV